MSCRRGSVTCRPRRREAARRTHGSCSCCDGWAWPGRRSAAHSGSAAARAAHEHDYNPLQAVCVPPSSLLLSKSWRQGSNVSGMMDGRLLAFRAADGSFDDNYEG